MKREARSAEQFGREVLGPISAEFCLHLWQFASLLSDKDTTSLLFCARGGLRMWLLWQKFLEATQLPEPTRAAPLMISRLVAMRAALARSLEESETELLPAAANTLSLEFRADSTAEAALALSGVQVHSKDTAWDAPATSVNLVKLLQSSDGRAVREAIIAQAELFRRHLDEALAGTRRAVLVDTGLFGTTRELLAEGVPDVDFASALIARSFRAGPRSRASFGLLVEAPGYDVLRRRSALLRHWHFVEWLFEPDLPSVRTFADTRGEVASNLESDGWIERLQPVPGTAFAGLVDYVENLRPGMNSLFSDVNRAWKDLNRSIVWPNYEDGLALAVGQRSHDFGREGVWAARRWSGPFAALRGSVMWREGEIARSGTPLRVPLLAFIEAMYTLRQLKRVLLRRLPRRWRRLAN